MLVDRLGLVADPMRKRRMRRLSSCELRSNRESKWHSTFKCVRGEVMIESLLVYGVTVILLFLMLTVFSLLYQNWNVQTIANDTAAKVAQLYRYESTDLTVAELGSATLENVRPYRYLFNGNGLERSAKTRSSQFAKDRLRATTFAVAVGEPTVDAVVERDGLARRHVAVTVTGTYQVPGSQILKYLGGTGDVVFSHTGYAECMDLSDYLITTNFTETAFGAASGTAVGKAIDSVLRLVHALSEEE